MAVLDRINTATLRAFPVGVETSSTIVTDGFKAFSRATQGIHTHQRPVAPGALAVVDLPGAHCIATHFTRVMLDTHQRSASWDHLECYLDEFVFRLNRRRSRYCGLVI